MVSILKRLCLRLLKNNMNMIYKFNQFRKKIIKESFSDIEKSILEFEVFTKPVFEIICDINDVLLRFEDDGLESEIIRPLICLDQMDMPIKIDFVKELISLNKYDVKDLPGTPHDLLKGKIQLKVILDKNWKSFDVINLINHLNNIRGFITIDISYRNQEYNCYFFKEYLESMPSDHNLGKIYLIVKFEIWEVYGLLESIELNDHLIPVIPNRYVYHKSGTINRDSISKNGLIPKGKSGTWLEDTKIYGNVIFATNSENTDDWFDSTWDDDVYKIDTMGLKNKWFIDPNFGKKYFHIITFDPIPPKNIELIYLGSGEDQF